MTDKLFAEPDRACLGARSGRGLAFVFVRQMAGLVLQMGSTAVRARLLNRAGFGLVAMAVSRLLPGLG